MASNIPVIVQGNSFNLAIPLQMYVINGDQMELQDYTPDPTDQISIQLKGSRRNYTYTPTSVTDNVCMIALGGYELADNYSVVVSIVKSNGQRLRSFRTDQFFIVESSDDLTQDDIIQGLEENVIYLNSSIFVAGEDGRGIVSIVKTSTSGLVDTYTITYSDATTSTFNVTNGAQGEPGATISSVEKTATAGKVDTYTITMTDGNTFEFEVTNGMDGVDLGLANIVNDTRTGGTTNVLSAEQGKVIRQVIEQMMSSLGEYAFINGKPQLNWGDPFDAKIEYLGCDGGQYIDTGITGNKATGFEMAFRCANTNEVAGAGGSRSTNTNAICFATKVGAYGTQRFGSQSYAAGAGTVVAGTDYTYKIDATGFWINGSKLSTWSQSSSFTTDTHLFVGWNGNDTTSKLKGRIYSVKIYDNGVIVFDAYPVRIAQVGYLYDRISGTLFGNSGSGSFTLGNDITA